MPRPEPKTRPSETDERLSQLLALKRLERPDAAFWQTFEQEFRSKQMSSLVGVESWQRRYLRFLARFAQKASIPGAAVASALAIGFLGFNQLGQLAESPDAPTEVAGKEIESPTEALFVVQPTSQSQFDSQAKEIINLPPPATYQVSVMSKPNDATSYQLFSSPIILSPQAVENSTSESGLGAKVITTEKSF